MTKCRPIIMSSDSVRAILDGRKTQTRRVVNEQPENLYPVVTVEFLEGRKGWRYRYSDPDRKHSGGSGFLMKCSFGAPGDRLWVREAFWLRQWSDNFKNIQVAYDRPAERTKYILADKGESFEEFLTKRKFSNGWQNPMFMPRWASRLTLEITNVRCERVQKIALNDVWDEGYKTITDFKEAWDALNGKRKGCSWNDNPWVFVLEFKKIEGGDNE